MGPNSRLKQIIRRSLANAERTANPGPTAVSPPVRRALHDPERYLPDEIAQLQIEGREPRRSGTK
jgi:hypothetical protein